MVSSRRSRIIILAAVVATIIFFIFSSDSRSAAMNAAQAATGKARAKVDALKGESIPEAGAPKAKAAAEKVPAAKEKGSKEPAAKEPTEKKTENKPAAKATDTKGDTVVIGGDVPKQEVETFNAAAEYKRFLSKSPVVIFSKSGCPYSKAAKELLLKKYTITPEPFVVELDLHPHGADLQKHIGSVTGRRTVPNIHIQGVSRGGCDDFRALEEQGKLVANVNAWFAEKKETTGFESPSIKKAESPK